MSRPADPHAFSVCIGMDALRLCVGMKPKNYSAAEVIRWLTLLHPST